VDFFKNCVSFICAVSTITFPLLNKLFVVLPLISSQEILQTTLASVFSAYAFRLCYSLRGWLPKKKLIASVSYSVVSLFCLLVYLYFSSFSTGTSTPERNLILVASYVLLSFCLTSAFSMLAVPKFMFYKNNPKETSI
jgi:hypothetical protein